MWPGPPAHAHRPGIVQCSLSNIYGVAVEDLGAHFWLIRQPGEREVWVDVFRSPDNHHLVRDRINEGQRRDYGTMLAMIEVA